ncbi:MAG TPA: hypothetical protein VLF67_04635 [Candidatus Saccharimonas sp.]|nr:hypothetical protein [Candidatus Saccharimonas sp.]
MTSTESRSEVLNGRLVVPRGFEPIRFRIVHQSGSPTVRLVFDTKDKRATNEWDVSLELMLRGLAGNAGTTETNILIGPWMNDDSWIALILMGKVNEGQQKGLDRIAILLLPRGDLARILSSFSDIDELIRRLTGPSF